MNFNGIRRLYLPLRPKVRFSPGRKTPPVLSEVPHELSTDAHSKECKRSPQQFIPAGFPLPRPTSHGDGRLSQPPHHTGPGPVRTRPPFSIPHLNYCLFFFFCQRFIHKLFILNDKPLMLAFTDFAALVKSLNMEYKSSSIYFF